MPSALVQPRVQNEYSLTEGTTSIATSPVAAQVAVPARGVITRCFANATGTTTGTITVAVSVNGGADICNGKLQIAAGSGNSNVAGVELNQVGAGATSGVTVNEGDVVTFTPSGGTGANIGGSFTLAVRKQ
jgi:hypothetical protein